MSWIYQPTHEEEKAKRGIYPHKYDTELACCDPSVLKDITTYTDGSVYVKHTLVTPEESIEINFCPFCGKNLKEEGA